MLVLPRSVKFTGWSFSPNRPLPDRTLETVGLISLDLVVTYRYNGSAVAMAATVWLSRRGPVRPIPTRSNPHCALTSYPKFAWKPRPSSLMPYWPTSSQLEDLFKLNNEPLDLAQLEGTLSKTSSEQPRSDSTTMVCGEAVETSTLTCCSGCPTRMSKVLHGPSLPSLHFREIERQVKKEALTNARLGVSLLAQENPRLPRLAQTKWRLRKDIK